MSPQLIPKNLVTWPQDGGPLLGVVLDLEHGQLRVRFDDGQELAFASASDVLERTVFPKGQHVRVLASDTVGVVNDVRDHNGLALYTVSLPNGSAPTVIEDGVRPAVISDPFERLRAGELDGARSTNLRLAATRLLYGYQHDELSTLGNSRVEIKPHQVGVVHRVAESYPHRFILADEVGLGKTIEAGLLIRELLAREVVKRILVLAPSGLVGQWQYELKTKFNMAFSLYNGDSIKWLRNEHPTENVWTVRDQVIASTNFASWDEDRRREIAGAGWDMVIIDEAHHARRTYEGPNKSSQTQLYRLATALADPDLARAQSMLLLTATPMQLHPFELFSLIELLDPALFPTYEDFDSHRRGVRGLNRAVETIKDWESRTEERHEETLEEIGAWIEDDHAVIETRINSDRPALVDDLVRQHRLSQVMVRNRKRVVGGFQPRTASIWEVELSEKEWAAYWATTEYLRTGFARSRADKNNALGFLMAIFQKLNTSSSHALKRSLTRRIEKLEGVTEAEARSELTDADDLEEKPTAEALDALLSERMDADWEEIRDLEKLVRLLDEIKIDSKAVVLLEKLEQILEQDPEAKILLFTQFRDTQSWLEQHIERPWTVHLFHGQLKPQEKDANVARFRDSTGPQILLSTEAGGEGRNFQFCHMLVNYDLPWNPMKVEQRIGRVDRIGQKHPVVVFNFSTKGTIEERVVDVLQRRIGVFEETIGGLDPILGEVESDLRGILLLAEAESSRQLEAYEAKLENRVTDARNAQERLADLIMDTSSYRKEEVERLLDQPRAVEASDVKRFVLGALAEMEVSIDRDFDLPGVFILRFSPAFERFFPDEFKQGMSRRVTFELSVALEREEVDFLAFGHPIVDGLVAHVRDGAYHGLASSRVIMTDEVEAGRGWFFVFSLEWAGLTDRRELWPVFVDDTGGRDDKRARWLLDRVMTGRREEFTDKPAIAPPGGEFDLAVALAESSAIDKLLERQTDLETTNSERLEEERRKRERFYDYRAQAATDKVEACRKTYERLAASEEPADQRILPVWKKNLETARRMIETIGVEREQRLSTLEGKDSVKTQHERVSASFVTIGPDPQPLFDQVAAELPESMFRLFRKLCRPATVEEVAALGDRIRKRRKQLLLVAQKHQFNVKLAVGLADALAASLQGIATYSPAELNLLYGAIEYFLEIEDESPDLKSPAGFDDDALVANIVLGVIGRPELAAEN